MGNQHFLHCRATGLSSDERKYVYCARWDTNKTDSQSYTIAKRQCVSQMQFLHCRYIKKIVVVLCLL